MEIFFRYQNYSDTQKKTYDYLRHAATKNFRRKIVISFSMHKFYRYAKLSETLKGSRTKIFGIVRQKIFDRNCDIPVLCKFFSIRELFRYTEFFHTNTFGIMRQNVFDRKLRYSRIM